MIENCLIIDAEKKQKCLPERLVAYHCGRLCGCRAAGRFRALWRLRKRRRTYTGRSGSCSGTKVRTLPARDSEILYL